MKIVAFDTSTKYLTIACLEDAEAKASHHEDAGISHSELLVPTIKDLASGIGWSPSDMDLICVGLGPGSFTGLRISAATAKGFAASLGCKLVGVPTMDAMVMNYAGDKGVIAPLLDARKGKVYSCLYARSDGKWKKKTDYLLVTIDDLLDSLEEETVFFGDAVEEYRERIDEHPFAGYDDGFDWYPNAVNIGLLGLGRSFLGTDNPEELEPLYLHAKECNIVIRGKKQ